MLLVFVPFILHIVCVLSANVSITVFAPKNPTKRLFALERVQPAVEIAIDHVMTDKLRGHAINVEYVNSNASDVDSPVAAFKFMSKGVHLFIGPVYDFGVAPVARYAPKWNIPVISPGAFAHSLNQKRSFQTLTRVHTTFNSMAEFFYMILQHFGWTKIKAVSDRFGRNDIFIDFCDLAISSIHQMVIINKDKRYVDYEKYEILREQKDRMTRHVLDKINTKFAVVVLCASADSVRDILIKAHELNFDNGEYVFLNIDLFSSKNDSEKPWYRAGDTDERNKKAMKAYEALMTVTLRKPTSKEYKNFSMEVKRRAKEKNVNFTYGEEEVNSFVGAFHDAVILYALALNETLAANKSITDGAEITNRMWNRTFEGITGTVSIDENGDRNADYSLLDMNPHTHKFEVVANYFGKDKDYKEVEGKHIHWAGGRTSAPPDTPKCGFDGSKCPPDKPFPEYGIVIIVLGSLLVIVLVAAFFIYRHIKLEAELAEMNWRVKWEDIMFGTMENDKKLRRQGSTLSLTRTNGEACAEGRVLIERSDTVDQSWCKCGQCEESDRRRRVCCRQLELFGIFDDGTNCITTTDDFRNVVLNKEVLLAVFIHVMLVRRQRGGAPLDLSACKLRLMATRQFLCWMHRGQKLKKESRMSIPSCVSRAIHMKFPDEVIEVSSTSRGSCTTTTLAEMMPLEIQT